MKAIPRKGSWRKSSPGVYVKNIGTYGNVKFGATVRVSFVPFPTCEILDANYVSVGIPTPADEKKFTAAAKKVYTKDTKAEAERVQKRATAKKHKHAEDPKKYHSGMIHVVGVGWHERAGEPEAHKGRSLVHRPPSGLGIHGSIRALGADIQQYKRQAAIDPANAPIYQLRIKNIEARIKKLRE